MGACYSVTLQIRVKDAEGLKKALQDRIARAEQERVNYGLERFKEIGVDTNAVDGLLQVIFGSWDAKLKPTANGSLEADFNASYGWEMVMLDAFDAMAPFLEEGSQLEVWPDDYYDLMVVEGGKAIVKH